MQIDPHFVRKGCMSWRLGGTAPGLKREDKKKKTEKKREREGERRREKERERERERKREDVKKMRKICADVKM